MKFEFDGIIKGQLFDVKLLLQKKSLSRMIFEVFVYAVFFILGMLLFNEVLDLGLIIGGMAVGITIVAPTKFNEYQNRRMLVKFLMKDNNNGK